MVHVKITCIKVYRPCRCFNELWQTAFLMRSCISTWTLLFSSFEVDNCQESYIMLKVRMPPCTIVASHLVPPAKHVRKNTLWLPLATAAARKAKGEFACRKWRKPQTPSGWIEFNNNSCNGVDVDSQLEHLITIPAWRWKTSRLDNSHKQTKDSQKPISPNCNILQQQQQQEEEEEAEEQEQQKQ